MRILVLAQDENKKREALLFQVATTDKKFGYMRIPRGPIKVIELEPSTSQSALNFSILPRPPLNRSHLNFSTLNSPALHCQPSTSAAFPIGSSGFSLIKEIKDSTSQHEDDNISTTSGFSSRASDKEADRSQSVPQKAGTTLRKPAFNLSVFGGSSTSLASSSALNSSQLGDSPFYPGKTTYGGAAAVRSPSSRVRGTPYQAPVRRQITAKQIHSPCGVTSATARRILQSLERMSSPLADAKRIPSHTSSPLSPSDAQHPPVQKLVTPKAASVAVNRSMFFKPSLTPTGHSSRSADRVRIQCSDHVYTVLIITSSFSYPSFSTPAANGMASGGAGGKMKRERGTRASSKPAQDQEQVEVLNLPHISLPMRMSTLPTLNFSTANTSPSVMMTTPVANKVSPATSIQNRTDFTFSSPIFKATEMSPLPLTPSAGFTFSAPVSKTVASDPSGTTSTPSAMPVQNCSTFSSAVGTPVNTNDEDFGPFRPAKTLKQGSVLDILKGPEFSSSPSPARSTPVPVKPFQMSSTSSPTVGFGFGDKFKPATGSWQCDACLLQNKPTDSKCVACQTAKPNIDSSKQSKCSKMPSETLQSLGDKFKPVSGTWECDTCLVQNKPEVTKCVACETSKPGTGVKSALTLPAFSECKLTMGSGGSTSTTTTTSSLSSGFGFGEKFKKPEGAWDCDVCLVQNKAEDMKCVACQCAKPGAVAVPSTAMTAPESSGGLLGFGDKFKKPEGSWDCDVCAVENKAEVTQCMACQSAKPGAKVETKGFSSSAFSSATTASPFGFGIQSSSMDSSATRTGGFTFGDQGGIKFGTSTTDDASSGGIKFGTAKSEDSRKADSQTIGSGFKFGASGGIQFGTGNCSSQSENKAAEPKSKPSLEGFSFGISAPPKADEKTADGGFKFGAPKEKLELGGTAAAVPFSFGKQEEKKLSGEQLPAVGFAFGKPVEEETGTLTPAAAAGSTFVLGKTDQPDPISSSSSLMFSKGKVTDKPAPQLGFAFGKPETSKEEAKPTFSFGKPAEKQEAAVQPKPAFAFGAAPATAGAVAVPSTAMTAPESSGGLLGFGDKFKKPEGSWDCDVCAVENKAEVTQCMACQSAKPGAKVETKGFSSSAFSSATTASPFGFGIQSSSMDSSATRTGGFTFGDQGGIKFGTSTTDDASSGGIKFGTAKSEDSRKADSQTIGSGFKFGASGGIQFGTGNCSSQSENKAAEPKSKPSLEGFSFGISAPPKADEKTADGGFKFGAPKEKLELGGTAAAVPFSFGKQEEKKLSGEQLPAVGFAFGKPVEEETGTLTPAAAAGSTFVLGKTDQPDPISSSSSLMFSKGKVTDKPAPQLGFAFGKPETSKEEAKPTFSFGKPAEKQEAAVQPKPAFAFGAAPATADLEASKPAYNFMASVSASATVTAASAASSTPATNMFGSSSTSAPIAPVSTFVFGQASSTGFSSGASETTTSSKGFMFGAQESKAPAAGASPFMFVTGSNTAATAAFGFGSATSAAPTTTSSTGSSASPFVFGSASSTPGSAPAFGASQTPAFGQGSNQPSAPAFGSPAAALFSAGSQPPAFGSQASTSQPSVFGQQSNQPPAFGAAVAASAAPGKTI
ncbi:Nuclear pore complex protein Nup153 [Acipenser ruthenus]|uniref:Nuclear pore complex protein Nup153 n=1 Tax=Acipenser ruthenus TaxID=7906 RepID=A0A662YYE1_ACIRT|nr:Nuclear pore complex protein Nup153 [Acipenser ruthenus]